MVTVADCLGAECLEEEALLPAVEAVVLEAVLGGADATKTGWSSGG